MEFNKQIKVNIHTTDFAYWIGVVQTDGFLKKLYRKNRNKVTYYIGLGVGNKSKPMLNKFITLSKSLFEINGSFFNGVSKEGFETSQFIFGCTSLMPFYKEIDLNFKDLVPPIFVLNSEELFGAYLGGVIDGDGDINISREDYPQCKIRICSGKQEPQLATAIEKILNCKVNQYKRRHKTNIRNRYFISNSVKIEFRVIPKNFDFMEEFVLSNMALDYKSIRVRNYIKFRRATGGI